MLIVENINIYGWEPAIRGMRNPMNSWAKSDSGYSSQLTIYGEEYVLGPNDLELAKILVRAGTDHSKFMRMITVTADITAPLYWWKEYDTYKIATVANSCSTMHKITEREFTLDDFSHEHLDQWATATLRETIRILNIYRSMYHDRDRYHGDVPDRKTLWWQIIQLLPSSYNQRRTVQLNYAVLRNIYHARRNHKLDEWHTFCDAIRNLPYSELITGGEKPCTT